MPFVLLRRNFSSQNKRKKVQPDTVPFHGLKNIRLCRIPIISQVIKKVNRYFKKNLKYNFLLNASLFSVPTDI